MKLTSKGDIAAPTDFVWTKMSDYEAWERAIRKRNTVLERSPGPIAPGTTWNAKFRLRGRDRDMVVTLLSEDPGRRIHLSVADASLDLDIVVDLLAMTATSSRVVAALDLRPRNLTARLLVQSLRLARGKVQDNLDGRVEHWAAHVEDQYRARAPIPEHLVKKSG